MEQKEIGPEARDGEAVGDQETERFEEATGDQGLVDSRRASPSRELRQTMYREFAGARIGSDRNASPGVGQSSDPVHVQTPSRGNPFGGNVQARPLPPVQGNQSYPNFP